MPKVASAPDTVLQKTLSNAPANGVVPKGATLKGVRIIAGAGTSSELLKASRLAEQYGGLPEQWEKKGGIAKAAHFSYDVHWYELDGIQYEQKIKGKKEVKA